ncbi:MAG: hypothetical protein JO192_05850, partial [Candidatus Eremiobacteraeota bacterium]|nr:hypothetical protein [Candidatus Eremiobacteraeota bacterium]
MRAALVCFCCGVAAFASACSQQSASSLPPKLTENGASAIPHKLGGVKRVKKFYVLDGLTEKVTHDLTVFATEGVDIAGTLEVPQGTRVAFYTPSYDQSGTIAYAGQSVPAKTPVTDIISACTLIVHGGAGLTVPPGDSLALAASKGASHKCTTELSGNVTMS